MIGLGEWYLYVIAFFFQIIKLQITCDMYIFKIQIINTYLYAIYVYYIIVSKNSKIFNVNKTF